MCSKLSLACRTVVHPLIPNPAGCPTPGCTCTPTGKHRTTAHRTATRVTGPHDGVVYVLTWVRALVSGCLSVCLCWWTCGRAAEQVQKPSYVAHSGNSSSMHTPSIYLHTSRYLLYNLVMLPLSRDAPRRTKRHRSHFRLRHLRACGYATPHDKLFRKRGSCNSTCHATTTPTSRHHQHVILRPYNTKALPLHIIPRSRSPPATLSLW